MIPIPPEDIALLVQKYVPEDIFQFCAPDVHHAATSALYQLGNPKLEPTNAWNIFAQVLPLTLDAIDSNQDA
jgi:hypothetical protein